MSCYHPLKGWPIGRTKNGKVSYKITGYETDHIELINGTWTSVPTSLRGQLAKSVVRDYVDIPCGQCIGCRMDYSRQWANRLMLELEYHDSAYFVTLTYRDADLPTHLYSDPDTGEAFPSYSLDKRDCQLFMKRLRKLYPNDRIRFFLSGEYGPSTHRPHYHAIIFGLHLDDLYFYKKSGLGFDYLISDKLADIWGKGYVVVSEVTWETCAYTARYVTKKLTGDAGEFYTLHNIAPPFSLMSRRPGIAAQWYEDHPGLYDTEYINISTEKGARKFRPPKYFDRLYERDNPDEYAELKECRKRFAEEMRLIELEHTNLDYIDYLKVKEDNFKKRIKILEQKRGDL